MAQLGTPAGQEVAYVAIRFPGEQRRGTVPGQLGRQVLADQRRAQARDEPAEVVTFKVAEQGGRAGEPDSRAVDLGEARVEHALQGGHGLAVGVSWLMPQREQHVEIGYSGHGCAAGNAPVEIAAVQAIGAEAVQDGRLRRRYDSRECSRHEGEITFAPDEAIAVKPRRAHARMLAAPGTRPHQPRNWLSVVQNSTSKVRQAKAATETRRRLRGYPADQRPPSMAALRASPATM